VVGNSVVHSSFSTKAITIASCLYDPRTKINRFRLAAGQLGPTRNVKGSPSFVCKWTLPSHALPRGLLSIGGTRGGRGSVYSVV